VGTTAKQWTLRAQILRDPKVAETKAILVELRTFSKELDHERKDLDSVSSRMSYLSLSGEYGRLYHSSSAFHQSNQNIQDNDASKDKVALYIVKKMQHSNIPMVKNIADHLVFRMDEELSYSSLFGKVWTEVQAAIVAMTKVEREAVAECTLRLKTTCRAVLVTVDSCSSAISTLDHDCNDSRYDDQDDDQDDQLGVIGSRISLAVLDEAGTVPESKVCSIIANMAKVTRIISIGDQEQLEPFTQIKHNNSRKRNPYKRAGGGGRSLRATTEGYFHRCVRVLVKLVPMLETQFRMHPQICNIVSNIAYNGILRTDPGVTSKRLAKSRLAIFWKSYASKYLEDKPYRSKSYSS
jgi:superfamily I DNA and/or RNA helicase